MTTEDGNSDLTELISTTRKAAHVLTRDGTSYFIKELNRVALIQDGLMYYFEGEETTLFLRAKSIEHIIIQEVEEDDTPTIH